MAGVTNREIAEAVLALSAKKSQAHVAKALANFLVQERRTKDLDAVMREVARLREAREDIVEVNLTSAFPLSAQAKSEVIKLVSGKKPVINEIIDKEVIGGVRVETNSTLLDLTVRNRLQQLKGSAKTK